MKHCLIILLGLITNIGISQSVTEDALEEGSEASEAQIALELESLLLDYELIRSSGFNNGKKIISESTIQEMKTITAQVKELKINSFASEYLQFKEDGFTEQGLAHLKIAESKTINKSELYSDFLAMAHILKKHELLQTYSTQLKNSGFLKNDVLEYNKNVLRSFTEANAFLITNGWEDTYPLLTLLKQEGKSNITVINVEWLYDNNYRNRLAQQLGKPSMSFSNNPYTWINGMTKSMNAAVYYTPTLPNAELVKLQDELTPVGILFKRGFLTADQQKSANLAAWNRFSKLSLTSSNALNKNYIIMLTLLEQQLATDSKEKGTLSQITSTKKATSHQTPKFKIMGRSDAYKSLTDEELMVKVQAGDQLAFGLIYDRYSSMAVNFFFKMLWKDREKAEDFMQDLFMKLVNKPEHYDSSRPFKTWFFSVANNMCKNEYRKAEVRVKAEPEVFQTYNKTAVNSGEAANDKKTFMTELNAALEDMEQVKRSVFIMRFKHGFSIKEISEVLECSEGTVKSRIFYTVKQLNSKLSEFKNIAGLFFIQLFI